MNARRYILSVIITLFSLSIYAQNEITLINGQTFTFEKITVDTNWIKFDYKSKNGKLKHRLLNHEDVFSYKKDNQESVVYRSHLHPEDTAGMLSVPEMQLFVTGQQQAHKVYKPIVHAAIGAAVGFIPAASSNSVLVSLLIPPAFAAISTLIPVRKSRFNEFGVDVPNVQRYGQKRQYRRLRTGTTIKAGFIGAVAGFLVSDYIFYH